MITEMKYLWVHNKNPNENVLTIVDDPTELVKNGEFNEAFDKFYQIGNEVKVKVSIEPTTTYREGNFPRTKVS